VELAWGRGAGCIRPERWGKAAAAPTVGLPLGVVPASHRLKRAALSTGRRWTGWGYGGYAPT
jgi:hypothetical protein